MEATINKIFILSIFTLLVSCRITPHDENLAGENNSSSPLVSMKINLLGVEWTNEINENPLISENNSRGGG